MFSWWLKDPYRKLDDALNRYARTLRERVVGFKPEVLAAAAEDAVAPVPLVQLPAVVAAARQQPPTTSPSSATRSAPKVSRPISPTR